MNTTFNAQQLLNLGEGTISYGSIGFTHYEDSTLQNVIDTVRDWAEQRVVYGQVYNYRQLAADFNIPSTLVEEIEAEVESAMNMHLKDACKFAEEVGMSTSLLEDEEGDVVNKVLVANQEQYEQLAAHIVELIGDNANQLHHFTGRFVRVAGQFDEEGHDIHNHLFDLCSKIAYGHKVFISKNTINEEDQSLGEHIGEINALDTTGSIMGAIRKLAHGNQTVTYVCMNSRDSLTIYVDEELPYGIVDTFAYHATIPYPSIGMICTQVWELKESQHAS